MILIGSKAFAYHGINLPRPKDYKSDIDLIANEEELNILLGKKFRSWKIGKNKKIMGYGFYDGNYEVEVLPSSKSSEMLYNIDHSHKATIGFYKNGSVMSAAVPSLKVLYFIKKSHIIAPIHWYKNIEDYHYLKKDNRLPFEHFYKEDEWIAKFYRQRVSEVEERVKTKINLMKNNDLFFEQNVTRFVSHDLIHDLVKFYDIPMYQQIKIDRDMAYCNKELWDKLSQNKKEFAIIEEAEVIALERIIIPKLLENKEVDQNKAYLYALMRISTTLTKGWFREFAIENYPVLKYPKHNLIEIAKTKILPLIKDIEFQELKNAALKMLEY